MFVTAPFPDFLERQYLKWQHEQGKRKTLDDFAIFLGISRPLLSMWMNGARRPGTENIDLLVKIFGLETYDALELPRPNPYLEKISEIFEQLSPEHQRQLAEDAERYETQNDNAKKASKPRKTAPHK